MSHLTVVKFMDQNAGPDLPENPLPGTGEPGAEAIVEAEAVDWAEAESVAAVDPGQYAGVYGSEERQTEPAWFPLDIRFVRLEQITGMILWAVLATGGLAGFGTWFFVSGPDWIWWLSFGGSTVIAGLIMWTLLFWPVIAHRHVRWRLDETGLEIRRGVFWKYQISVPLARLQHADISQGPFQRRFGVSKLTVHTAGTANASVALDGLAIETATWLRDMLIRQKEAQDVV